MDALRPIVVANEIATAEQIRSAFKESGLHVQSCAFEDCRAQISWHRKGVMFVVAETANDWPEITKLVQEARLRQSPLELTLIQKGDLQNMSSLAEEFANQFNWPTDIEKAMEVVRSGGKWSAKDESLVDILTNRLVQHTPSLLPQVSRLALAAAHDITVLLTGETGTGKTYLARLLHDHSPRRKHPFLMVPCGAQPSNLFESTFFGHVKGAFTGAHQSRVGRFAAAGKGTILLDEIDALGLEPQASLLRVIETGEYELVGGNETFHSEARIIVACNSNLEDEVAKGVFRQDLFYRLNVMSFHLQPLRKRRQDIALLARSIVARFNTKFGKGLYDITPEAIAALQAYHWPGNIRQLENVLQEAVLVSTGSELTVFDLPDLAGAREETNEVITVPVAVYESTKTSANGNGNGNSNGHAASATLLGGRAAYERGLIQKTLTDCNYNRSRAARALGVSRVTLYKKLKQYGLPELQSRRA